MGHYIKHVIPLAIYLCCFVTVVGKPFTTEQPDARKRHNCDIIVASFRHPFGTHSGLNWDTVATKLKRCWPHPFWIYLSRFGVPTIFMCPHPFIVCLSSPIMHDQPARIGTQIMNYHTCVIKIMCHPFGCGSKTYAIVYASEHFFVHYHLPSLGA